MTSDTGIATSSETFTQADLDEVREATAKKRRFEWFILMRFTAYTRTGLAVDDRGRKVEPRDETELRDCSGYGTWRLAHSDAWDTEKPTNPETVLIEHHMADDRGPSSITARVEVPWSFIFGDDEREQRRAQYLALKAEFEPTE